ncbi:hypothetical protein [Pseudochrobactrum asaccharolyticum]|uniref:Uncharacterized protein n=1 Tax=Pseudochrobactrum asaccharolyticum TaxID=354351 RepID=A0A366DGZ3_9HYPH|nr:hypothetical protein [Pseudochrobactrum asaccharolyticum]RBO89281.1 hypothetical protein DFR47_1169 [Pseudochrobactrum asaccharolyticum]
MKFGSLGAAVTAAGMCFLTFAPAQAATMGEAIDMMAEMIVLENLCPDLRKNMDSVHAFLKDNGITDGALAETSIFSDELEAAAKRSFGVRKDKTREENCADAIELYGANGTKVKGHFALKSERAKVK